MTIKNLSKQKELTASCNNTYSSCNECNLTEDEIISILSSLSCFFEYPTEKIYKNLRSLKECVEVKNIGEIKDNIFIFITNITQYDLSTLEEVYNSTFEINPLCAPYIGVHLFGEENIRRAMLMSLLKSKYNELSLDFGNELPDHISVLLKLLPYLKEDEQIDLIKYMLILPVEKMANNLDHKNPYRHLLLFISALLRKITEPVEITFKSETSYCSSYCSGNIDEREY